MTRALLDQRACLRGLAILTMNELDHPLCAWLGDCKVEKKKTEGMWGGNGGGEIGGTGILGSQVQSHWPPHHWPINLKGLGKSSLTSLRGEVACGDRERNIMGFGSQRVRDPRVVNEEEVMS